MDNDDVTGADRTPATAAILGAAGMLPFIALTVAPVAGVEPFGRPPLVVLGLYGAVILSFMGAVHWGLALRAKPGDDPTVGYVASVLPGLMGWFALAFLPLAIALRVMALGFVLILLFDLRVVRLGGAPAWYGRLRVPLTAIVVSCMLGASILA
jgi:Protein of unknown function (DUF3429)